MATSAGLARSGGRAGGQAYLLGIFALLAFAVPVCLFLGVRGFAPAVGLAGLLCLPIARPVRADWPGLLILLALLAWAAVSILWSPAPNLHAGISLKTLTHLTVLHLAQQLILCAALAVAAARLSPATADRALTLLSFALLIGLGLLVEEGVSHAALYQAMMAATHKATRPDLAVRALAQGGHVTAVLAWPLGMALAGRGRPRAALALVAFVPLSMVLMRGFSPTAGLVASLLVFFAVRRYGRPAVILMLVLTVAYMLVTPLVMLAIAHFDIYGILKDHMPKSWSERLRIWTFVIDQFLISPLRGAGLDASRTFPGVVPLHPHNGPLQLWYELGAPGAFLGAAFWGWLWWRIAGIGVDQPLFRAVAAATAAVYLVIGAVGFGQWEEWWICVGALALAVCIALGKFVDAPNAEWERPGPA